MAQSGPSLVDRDGETAEPAISSLVNLRTVREQTERILADPLFHNSKRYSDMLRYIVDRTLDGKNDCLKERIIGIEVFERPPDYDTSVDSIVRVAAAEVRKRLSRYYHESGHDCELRIELPTRSYVAEFRPPEPVLKQQQIVPDRPVFSEEPIPPEQPGGRAHPVEPLQPLPEDQPGIRPKRSSLSRSLWIAVAVCVLVFAGWGLKPIFAPTRAIDRFWAPMLNNSATTLIAIGSLGWLTAPPAAGSAAPISPMPANSLSQFITHQVNFPVADLSAANGMTTFLSHRGKDSVIRLSDSTTLSDLHGNPLIVLGSFPNEWALRLGVNLPFEFRSDGDLQWIEETSHPRDRRWMVNLRSPLEQVTSEYVLVTRAVDPTTGQWWIEIGGVTVLGTIAAQQLMINPGEMAALTAGLPKDWDRRNLQFVIEIKLVKGSAGASHVIAAQSW